MHTSTSELQSSRATELKLMIDAAISVPFFPDNPVLQEYFFRKSNDLFSSLNLLNIRPPLWSSGQSSWL
jgi:hypothetical protein